MVAPESGGAPSIGAETNAFEGCSYLCTDSCTERTDDRRLEGIALGHSTFR